jgi:hypothetical protein
MNAFLERDEARVRPERLEGELDIHGEDERLAQFGRFREVGERRAVPPSLLACSASVPGVSAVICSSARRASAIPT